MPLRILKLEIKVLKQMAFIYEFVKHIVENYPDIVREFNDKWSAENAKLQQEDNPTDGL